MQPKLLEEQEIHKKYDRQLNRYLELSDDETEDLLLHISRRKKQQRVEKAHKKEKDVQMNMDYERQRFQIHIIQTNIIYLD